jgi:hypothetical protein
MPLVAHVDSFVHSRIVKGPQRAELFGQHCSMPLVAHLDSFVHSRIDQDKVADKILILQSADKRMHPRRGIGCLTYISSFFVSIVKGPQRAELFGQHCSMPLVAHLDSFVHSRIVRGPQRVELFGQHCSMPLVAHLDSFVHSRIVKGLNELRSTWGPARRPRRDRAGPA